MEGKQIYAPDYSPFEGPLIFLAGPIQGTTNWQADAFRFIRDLAPEVNVASPRRQYDVKKGEFTIDMYNEQVDWETFHLTKAGENGTVLFWLASECDHNCSRAYAQTSRFELAEWKTRHENNGVNIVVGIEEGFTGAKYIRRRFSQDCSDVPISTTLEDTCRTAVEHALGKDKQ